MLALIAPFLTNRVCLSFSVKQASFGRINRPYSSSQLWSTHVKPDDVLIVSEMPEDLPLFLKNQYYLLRHGQSTGNVEGVISSSRELATSSKHGLTELGYEQGKGSATQLLDILQQENAKAGDQVIFYSSPFARAKQTAQACLDGLAETEQSARALEMGLDLLPDIQIEYGLMERWFGTLDDDAIETYGYVWPLDKVNVTHTSYDVESVAAVATRLRKVILDLERKYEGFHIVLTSHADVLQIMQLYTADAQNVGNFSSYRFANGEVRAMKRTPESLPEAKPLEPPKLGT
jgi:broad specificity phosphatase PhoE